MKKYIILSLLFLFSACETGTKYEENSTKAKESGISKQEESIRALIERESSSETLVKKSYIDDEKRESTKAHDPDNPLNGESIVEDDSFIEDEVVEERVVVNSSDNSLASNDISFQGGKISDGLNVKSIRVGRHSTYIRLVFDVDQWFDVDKHGGSVKKVGHYMVTYTPSKNRVIVTVEGYRGFSAKFPKFSKKDVIEKIYFNEYLDDSGFQFTIDLKDSVKIRAYDYENPARLIIDVTPLGY